MDWKIAKFINKIKPFSDEERENPRKMAENDERWTLNTSYDFDDEAIRQQGYLNKWFHKETAENSSR